jgi:hypothetical protein
LGQTRAAGLADADHGQEDGDGAKGFQRGVRVMTERRFGTADDNNGDKVLDPGQAAGRLVHWSRALAYGVLPGLVLVLALAAGILKWKDSAMRDTDLARIQSKSAAKDCMIALLTYSPDTVEKDAAAARVRLTGGFRDSYFQLARDVLIADARKNQVDGALAHIWVRPGIPR